MIKLCRAPNGSRYRLDAMMKGEIDATTLTEPHITLAEKKGCRVICSAFFHGTEVASDRVDAETYAAFNRAVREAVRRINADKKAYMHYFIDYYAKKDAEIAALKVEDLRESRLVVCDPAPIPADEMQRTYDWLKAGACSKTPPHRCSSSICRCKAAPTRRRGNRTFSKCATDTPTKSQSSSNPAACIGVSTPTPTCSTWRWSAFSATLGCLSAMPAKCPSRAISSPPISAASRSSWCAK